jgi:epoxyqueuosine reductase
MRSGNDNNLSRKIREYAISLGFDLIGIAPSKELTDHQTIIANWISEGMNADMTFISHDVVKRINPGSQVDNARSVIVAGMNYFPSEKQGGDGIPVMSKYAYGEDYHVVVSDKLNDLLNYIISCEPNAYGKICVDSSPILEKAWARESGLGWVGKNSLIINEKTGSFIFLGEIILNIELQYDMPFSKDLCGNCTSCLDACPTSAINKNRTIDARKCISWLTVENKQDIPEEFKGRLNNIIFGCDICQDVCPWNKNLIPHNNPRFGLPENLRNMSVSGWKSIDHGRFSLLFNKSSVRRLGYKRMIRNIKFVID